MNDDPFSGWAGKLPESAGTNPKVGWFRTLLLGLVGYQLLSFGVAIAVCTVATFYFVDHPHRLLISLILSSPVFVLLARQHFKSVGQFMEDFGATTVEGSITRATELQSLDNEYGRYASPPAFDLTIIWFIVKCSTVLAATYHLSGVVISWFK